MPRYSVMCIDQNRLFRDGLRSILSESDFPIIWETASFSEATAQIKAGAAPDVVLIEPRQRAGLSVGRDELARLRADLPRARIVVLSEDASDEAAKETMSLGFDGHITKDISPEALIHCIALVLIGEKIILTSSSRGPANRDREDKLDAAEAGGLTRMEVEILFLLSLGKSNREISRRLQVPESNLKLVMKKLFSKVKCENRIQAAIWATGSGIFTGPSARTIHKTTTAA